VSALTLATLTGWITGNLILTSLGKEFVSMAATTAIMFGILICSYFLLIIIRKKPNVRMTVLTMSYVVVLIGLLIFIASFFDLHPVFISLDFSTIPIENKTPTGHMSPLTSFLFVLTGTTVILLASSYRKRSLRTASQVLSGLVVILSGIALFTYILGKPLFYDSDTFPIALNTTIGFFATGCGLWILARIRGFFEIDPDVNESLRPLNSFPFIIATVLTVVLLFGYFNILTIFKNIHNETKNEIILVNQLKSKELADIDLLSPDHQKVAALLEWPVESKLGTNLIAGYKGDTLITYQTVEGFSGKSLEISINPDLLPGSVLANAIGHPTGFIKGTDTQGDQLIAFVSEIPGTSWVVLSAILEETAYRPLVKQLIQMTVLVFCLLILAIALLLLVSRQLRIRSYQEQIEATRILQEQLMRSNNEAQQSNRLKDAFIANISHEIRTPLNAIVGFTQLMRDNIAESAIPEYDKYFDIIQRSSERLTRTIEMILNVSRLQVGIYDLHPVEVSLEQKIRKLICEYSPAALKKGISIHFNNTMAKAVITADEYCVVHPISNLIDNAVKYTNQGDVTLKLYRNDEGLISLDVADTGIGISEEFISEIFRPFVQEDHGSTRRYEGIGLALAITQRLLTAIHATISVKSNKGKGTTFTITFHSEPLDT
jgi:signal transduction histidine kinase